MSAGDDYRLGRLRGAYVIKWTDDSGPHRITLGTSDRAAAEALARKFWAGRALAGASTVGEIYEAWLGQRGEKADSKRLKEAWRAAQGFWATVRPSLVDKDMCRAYARERGRAPNTIRNEIVPIRAALSWAHDKGLIAQKPETWVPAIPESEVHHLTKAQFRKFEKACLAPHVRLFVNLAIQTGARSGALLELPWVRVDLEKRAINLKRPMPADWIADRAAIKPRAIVPITDRLLPLLADAKEGALSPFVIEQHGERIKSIRKGMEAASGRSGVHCTPHMLRHTAAVWMAEERTPMPEIAAYLGHKNTRITEAVYARFHPDYLQRAGKALEW